MVAAQRVVVMVAVQRAVMMVEGQRVMVMVAGDGCSAARGGDGCCAARGPVLACTHPYTSLCRRLLPAHQPPHSDMPSVTTRKRCQTRSGAFKSAKTGQRNNNELEVVCKRQKTQTVNSKSLHKICPSMLLLEQPQLRVSGAGVL
jgi:hypothetical protein